MHATSRRAPSTPPSAPSLTLDRFDWTHPREIDRELYEELLETLGFITRGENVIPRGQAGVG